jgi:hypothetical protein
LVIQEPTRCCLNYGFNDQTGPAYFTPIRAERIICRLEGFGATRDELNKQMPWRPIGRMDDEELAAVYEYLTHLSGS